MTNAEDIKTAKAKLDQGEVIGFPTETVYGLAARIDLPSAIEKIFKIKERPFFDPLIVHVSSVDQAKTVTSHWGKVAQVLAEKFWPGPLTMVLPKAASVNPMITSGLESVGLRMPQHPVALEILNRVGVPLAAPSANKFGRTSPTSALHVRDEFKKENVFVVDGGDCQIGIESTVLLVKEKGQTVELSILRKGHVLPSEITEALEGHKIAHKFIEVSDKKESPGHMKHHYMPSVPLVICRDKSRSPESLLFEINHLMGKMPDEIESIKILKPVNGIKTWGILDLSSDPILAAREFYSKLRDVAALGNDCILFYREPYHSGERWESLFDRMNKAASLVL